MTSRTPESSSSSSPTEDRRKDLVKSRREMYASSFFKSKPSLPSASFNDKMRVKLDTYEVNRRGRIQTRQLTALKERAEALKASEEDQYIDETAKSMVDTFQRGDLIMTGTGRLDDTFEIEKKKIDVEASLYRKIEEGYKSSNVMPLAVVAAPANLLVMLTVDAIDGQLKICVVRFHRPMQSALSGANTTTPLSAVAAPINL